MQYNISEALAQIEREDARAAKFAGAALRPKTADDAAAMDAGQPFMALDAGGKLHLVGSVNPPKV